MPLVYRFISTFREFPKAGRFTHKDVGATLFQPASSEVTSTFREFSKRGGFARKRDAVSTRNTAEYANRTESKLLPGSADPRRWPSCQSNVAKCQDKGCENDDFPFIAGQNSKGQANALPRKNGSSHRINARHQGWTIPCQRLS